MDPKTEARVEAERLEHIEQFKANIDPDEWELAQAMADDISAKVWADFRKAFDFDKGTDPGNSR